MAQKRGSGAGSVFRTKSGWRGQIVINGDRKSVSGRTKGEVVQKLAELKTDYSRGYYVPDNDITVSEWVNVWLVRKVEPRIKEQSMIRLKSTFDNHLLPAIGDVRLQDLTKPLLEQTYAEIFQKKDVSTHEGSKNKKTFKEPSYSHSTVNHLSVQFKKCLQYAVDEGVLLKNPHNGVELHKLRPPKKVEAYTLEEHKKIVEFCRNNGQLYWIFYFLISTGMRFGEATALSWDDVNLKDKSIHIHKTNVNLHGSCIIQDQPKTASGNRTIYVSDNVITFLNEVKASQNPDLNYRNLVLPNKSWNLMNNSNALMHWKKACAIMDIPYKGIHTLRHTWATRALEKGVDVKTVSEMMGHKNVITTMNIYQDVLPEQKKKAAEKLDDLF